MMWYFLRLSPILVLTATRCINEVMRAKHQTTRDQFQMFVSCVVYAACSALLSRFIDFQGMTEVFESVFGPAEAWPAALLPIIPGMFLRSVEECPCSINGFVPEGKQGIIIAIFIRACTAVLPFWVQWGLWCSYSAPSIEYPFMFVEFVFCSYCWGYFETRPQASYAIYLLANQYRHPSTWFRYHSGGPSVILKRERRGLIWFITTSAIISIIENESGPSIVRNHALDLSPKLWVPLALILTIGIYLLRYGIALRIYKYKHKPLEKRNSIRLLRLRAQPCLPNAPIQCEMIHTSLHNPPQYVAVSHRWAEAGQAQEMILIDGGLFAVSCSIHTLLLAKRSNLHHRLFWIDSICINQEDIAEKNRQVGMMRRIFEEAELTLCWLGEDTGAKKAFALVARINEIKTESDYATLRSETDAGWVELHKMIHNSWFERVWTIQEVAVAKAQIIRYVNQEADWKHVARALWLLIAFSFTSSESDELVESNELLSALVMEELRCCVEDVDYLKLRDTLKLALRFKAALPVDKVYAMLGIVDERYTPLFYPKFASDGLLDDGRLRPNMVLKDIFVVVSTIKELLQEAVNARSGLRAQSRRGRTLLSLANGGVRSLKILLRDMKKLYNEIKYVEDGELGAERLPLRPDYSEDNTPQMVYTHVARDHIKDGEVLYFIGLAGIGLGRERNLSALPSWVPDWSTELGAYVLPHFQCLKSDAGEAKTSAEMDQREEPIFRDGGTKFLFIRASVVGTIAHTVALSRDYKGDVPGSRDDAKMDFVQHSSSFKTALALAHQHFKSSCQSPDLYSAFRALHYTLLARPSTDDNDTNFAAFAIGQLPSTHGISGNYCQIPAALWPAKFKEYWSKFPGSENPEGVKSLQTDMWKKYLLIRRMQSSANSKFAHLVKSEVIPSFSRYREQGNINIGKKKRISMLTGEGSSPLTGFARYVDYAIDRQLAILSSGLMALVPSGSREGDVIVQIQEGGRVMWLTLRQEDFPAQDSKSTFKVKKDCNRSKNKYEQSEKHDQEVPSVYKTARLVGESYMHFPSVEDRIKNIKEPSWFRLW